MPSVSPDGLPLPKSRLQAQCRSLARAILGVSAVLLVLLVLERTGPWLVGGVTSERLLVTLIGLVAPACYLFALWHTGRVLKIFADEGRFIAAAAGALKGVGLALAFGGAFQVFLVPGLDALAGHGPGYLIGIDAADTSLAVLGLALLAFARLFQRAARLERDLDGII